MAWSRWFPGSCSSLSVFVCYAHDDRPLAEEIAQALTNAGHDVFLDANKLKVSGDFNEAIRRAIERADRFIFLISKASMGHGKYPQTELDFAKDRWPAPQGKVFPVLVDPAFDVASLPVYLRSVQIHTVKGNAPAEIAAAIEKTRALKASCIAALAATVALLAGLTGFVATGGIQRMAAPDYEILKPQQVDFRPSKKPDAGEAWLDSYVAVTIMPVQYSNVGGKPVNILSESVAFKTKQGVADYVWLNKVDMKSNCHNDWLCQKDSIGAETLTATINRETMFRPAPGSDISWRQFLEQICTSNEQTLDVTLKSNGRSTSIFGTANTSRQTVCRVDLKPIRSLLEKLGCKSKLETPPLRLSPQCG